MISQKCKKVLDKRKFRRYNLGQYQAKLTTEKSSPEGTRIESRGRWKRGGKPRCEWIQEGGKNREIPSNAQRFGGPLSLPAYVCTHRGGRIGVNLGGTAEV